MPGPVTLTPDVLTLTLTTHIPVVTAVTSGSGLSSDVVPVPQPVNGTPVWIDDNNSVTGIPPTSIPLGQGLINPPSSASLNANATRYDNATRYGSGGYAVGIGFILSEGAGLLLNVSDGHVTIDGLMEVLDIPQITLTDEANNYVWIKQDGTTEVKTSSTDIPIGNCVYLGMVVTSAGDIQSIDYSGVVYWRGGQLWRETADIGPPLDSPDSTTRLYTKTATGTYYWDGTIWNSLSSTGETPLWKKVSYDFTEFQTAGTTNTLNHTELPAGAIVHAVKARVTTLFSGGAIATLTFDVGITGTLNKYLSAFNGAATGQTLYGTPSLEDSAAVVQTSIKATSTGANLSALTQGVVDVWIMYSVAV